jgi:hypothetical protein
MGSPTGSTSYSAKRGQGSTAIWRQTYPAQRTSEDAGKRRKETEVKVEKCEINRTSDKRKNSTLKGKRKK